MLSFHTAAAIAAAPSTASIEPALRQLLADRVHDWTATDLLHLTQVLVVEPSDTENDILQAVGFSPLVNPIDGVRWGSPCFQPHHDWLEQHGGWWELLFTIADSGWACFIFVQDAPGADRELLAFFKTYAGHARCAG